MTLMYNYCLIYSLRVQFYAMNVMRDRKVYRSGVEILGELKKKLLSQPYMLDFKVIGIDTVGKWYIRKTLFEGSLILGKTFI